MLRRVSALAIAAAMMWPVAAVAQDQAESEEDSYPMLMVSSWQCDFGDMGAIAEDWDTRAINAARVAVDDGPWADAGSFYHAWADEWNVNFWAFGEDVASLIEGNTMVNDAYSEMYPDDGLNLWDHCSAHKDSFYQMGQWTENPDDGMEDDAEGEDMVAISSWMCTDVGAVNEAWQDTFLPKAQAVVDAGEWNSAGVFYHTWGSEWNVNFYYIAEDVSQIMEGWQSYVASFSDDDPDITEYCHAHKDGIYQFGPSVVDSDEGGEG